MPPDPRFFPAAGPFSLEELAAIAGAEIKGAERAGQVYSDVSALDVADEHTVSFLDNKAYIDQFRQTGAGCCIVDQKSLPEAPAGMNCLVTDSPYLAYARVAEAFHPDIERFYSPSGSDPLIHPSSSIGSGTVIGAGAVVGPNAVIGSDCRIAPNTYIGDAVCIGDFCTIGPQVSIRFAVIGNNVSLFAGVRIGEPGFGFAASPAGAVTVPQLGRVLIEDRVEIGANTTIDRGAGPDTVIGAGTRIDNLVQIGHNVRIGKGCIIVAQTGIAGSCKIGNGVQLGGQVGIAGHLNIGDGARVAAQSGVHRDVEAGSTIGGTPAVPLREHFRRVTVLARLAGDKGR
jgi:UDP-3-O-[3-hydroxymyristoyl] glucosamine N-acyltransferase